MIYFMLKLRYISGDDPENENSKNKRKGERNMAEETKETKKDYSRKQEKA